MTGPCFFKEDFQFSLGSRQRMDLELLRQVIPNCVEVVKSDTALDKLGIDYVATLDGGAKVLQSVGKTGFHYLHWKCGVYARMAGTKVSPDGQLIAILNVT